MPSWGKALKVWWAFSWRTAVWMLAIVVPVALLVGLLRAVVKLDPGTAFTIASIIAWPSLIAGQIIAMRQIIKQLEPKQ